MKVAGWVPRLTAWKPAGLRHSVLASGGLFVLPLLAVGGWYWWSANQATGLTAFSHASQLAQDALAVQARPEQVEAATRALEEFIAGYPRHAALPQAAYYLGNLRYQSKAYDAARDAYATALRRGATESLAAFCRLGIGYAWEAQGNYPNAVAAYREAVANRKSKDSLYEEGLMAVGRTQELLQQRDQALETYRGILRDLPQSGRAEEVRFRLASLERSPRR